jgi:Tryptophan-associated transmembrane protein (Trp_oprn_chp)
VIVLLAGRSWPVGTKYRSAAIAAPSDPRRDPAAAWDALSRGEDPSIVDDTEDELGDDPGKGSTGGAGNARSGGPTDAADRTRGEGHHSSSDT